MPIDNLKGNGRAVAGFFCILIIFAVAITVLFGLASFSVWALKWIPGVIAVAFGGCLAVLPFAAIPATRRFAASIYDLASTAFIICLWLYALAYTYAEWGIAAVIIGIFVFGAGVILTGILAAIFSGTWMVLGNLGFLFLLYFAAKLLAGWLASSAERRRQILCNRAVPSQAVVIPAHRIIVDH